MTMTAVPVAGETEEQRRKRLAQLQEGQELNPLDVFYKANDVAQQTQQQTMQANAALPVEELSPFPTGAPKTALPNKATDPDANPYLPAGPKGDPPQTEFNLGAMPQSTGSSIVDRALRANAQVPAAQQAGLPNVIREQAVTPQTTAPTTDPRQTATVPQAPGSTAAVQGQGAVTPQTAVPTKGGAYDANPYLAAAQAGPAGEAPEIDALTGKAAAAAEANLLNPAGVWSAEEVQKAIDYYTKPYQQQLDDRYEALKRESIATGNWFSDARRDAEMDALETFRDDTQQGIVVPLTLEAMRNRQAATQGAIDQAAQIGGQRYGQALQSAQFDEAQRQFAASQNLNVAQVQEAINARLAGNDLADRQLQVQVDQFLDNFNLQQRSQAFQESLSGAEFDQRKVEFQAQYGLSAAQLQEAIDARLTGNDLSNAQLQVAVDQFIDEFNLKQRSQAFNESYQVAQLMQQQKEFAATFNLSTAQLQEAIDARKAGNDLEDRQLQAQIDQFLSQYELQKRGQEFTEKLSTAELDQRKTEFAQSQNLSYAQLQEAINARLAGNDLQDRALQVQVDQFIDEYKLKQRAQQFGEVLQSAQFQQEVSQWAQQIGLSYDQLYEQVASRVAGNDLQDRQLQEQIDARLDAARLREAELTGTLDGTLTLAGKQYNLNEKSQELADALAKAQASGTFTDPKTGLSVDTLQKWQTQLEEARLTGTLNNGTPTLQKLQQTWDQGFAEKSTFGYDREDGTHVYGTNELALVQQKNAQEFEQMLAAGFTYTDPETGQERRVKGTDERIDDEREWAEMTRAGYDTPVMRAVIQDDGSVKQVPMYDAQGQPVFRHVEGTQQLQSRLAAREAELTEKGMDLNAAHQQALLEWDRQQTTGFYQTRTVDFRTLGLDVPTGEFLDGQGNVDYDAFFRWADNPANGDTYARLRSALGHEPTPTEIDALVKGKSVAVAGEDGQPITDWVEGSVSLERARIDMQQTLQEAGFDQQTAEREAQQAYEEKIRNGYTYVDPTNGTVRYVRGTQSQEEYLLGLQQTFQMSEAEAQRTWDEQQRVGYDQFIQVGNSFQKIHVEGTQEFSERLAEAERSGTEDLVNLQWELAQKERTGYFKQVGNSFEWVAGTEDHEEKIQALADQLTRDGWDAEAALQQARITSSETEASKQRAHDKFLSERQWYYEQQSIDKADARQKAQQDWQSVEADLDRELSLDLADKNIAAADARLKLEEKQRTTELIIAAAAGLAKNVSSVLLGDSLGDIGSWSVEQIMNKMGVGRPEAQQMWDVFGTAGLRNGATASAGSSFAAALPPAAFAVAVAYAATHNKSAGQVVNDTVAKAYDKILEQQLPSGVSQQIQEIWTDYGEQGTLDWEDTRKTLYGMLGKIEENGGKPLQPNYNGASPDSVAGQVIKNQTDRANAVYEYMMGRQPTQDGTPEAGGELDPLTGQPPPAAAKPIAGGGAFPEGFNPGPVVTVPNVGTVTVSAGSAQSLPADKITAFLANGTLKIEGNLIKAGSGTVLGVIGGGAQGEPPELDPLTGGNYDAQANPYGANGAQTQAPSSGYDAQVNPYGSDGAQTQAPSAPEADKTAAQRELMNFGATISSLESLRYAQGADAVVYTIVSDARRRGTPMTYDYARQLATRAGIIA